MALLRMRPKNGKAGDFQFTWSNTPSGETIVINATLTRSKGSRGPHTITRSYDYVVKRQVAGKPGRPKNLSGNYNIAALCAMARQEYQESRSPSPASSSTADNTPSPR